MPSSSRDFRVDDVASPDHQGFFRALDALTPAQSIVLVGATHLTPVLRRLQAERPRQFDWDVLEAGPAQFRVRVTRRRTDAARQVTEYLQSDHGRLDALRAEAGRLAHAGAFSDAEACFAEFCCGLNRHIDAEETILFPTFEQMTGIANGPTAVMRAEHVAIRQGMGVASQALTSRDGAAWAAAIDDLADRLSMHNLKEEHVLYPATDRMTGTDQERDDLVTRLQAV